MSDMAIEVIIGALFLILGMIIILIVIGKLIPGVKDTIDNVIKNIECTIIKAIPLVGYLAFLAHC